MMSLHSRSLIALVAFWLTAPQLTSAQSPEPCAISPHPPIFEAGDAGDQLHALPHPTTGPHTAFHGQGLYGSDALYFSHLAVFMGLPQAHPHNFQIILEVDFADPEAKARYQADRAQHPDMIYTALPPRFDQTALVTQHPGREPLRHIPATTVFRGHFEQGGPRILEDVAFEIKRVVHYREFFLGGPKLRDRHYLLFGQGENLFLSHVLSAPPDFDQILTVQLEPNDVPTETLGNLVENLLAQGLYLHLPDRENTVATRLRAGDVLSCDLETGTRALPIRVELRVDGEAYCEEGEFVKLVASEFNRPGACGS